MTDLGILIGELKHAKEQSERQHEAYMDRFDKLETKIDAVKDTVNMWKWKAAGGLAAVTAGIGLFKLLSGK